MKVPGTAGKAADQARKLDSYGFNVLPAPPGEKAPTVTWKQWVSRRSTHMIGSWFPGSAESCNYWIATGGVSGVFVLDIDNDQADKWWREVVEFAAEMDATVSVKTAKGRHYYFWIGPNDRARGWALHEGGMDWDVRGEGGGVIAPPSIHASGFRYTWVKAPDPDKPMCGMVPAPDWMRSREGVNARIAQLDHGQAPVGAKPAIPLENKTRSMLSSLLAKPPAEGGRNDWLTKVAGHYAKTYRRQPDLFQIHCRHANALLRPPLDDDEFAKTTESIWTTEVEGHPERELTESTGFLMGTGETMLTQVKEGKGDDATLLAQEWADFDVRVRGVMASDEGEVVYDCLVTRSRDHSEVEAMLPGKVLGSSRDLTKLLAGYRVSIARPDRTFPNSPTDNIRLLRYLESQDAPRAKMVPCLGWEDQCDGFLTFDGVIRADGAHPFDGVRPDPTLAQSGKAMHTYDFRGGVREARAILSEVMTFHEDQIVSVFGAWWAACLLKPQLQRHTSLFPIMAIEAASGAGKTNGFFPLMMQLNGNIQGATQGTLAASRDKIAAHKSGIVWIDDMDSLGRIEELLRATTSNETIIKKGMDNTTNVNIPLVAPVVVSGEQLGLGSQKALLDRIIVLQPPKPDGRRSLKPGREDQPQWDDIVQLTNRYPVSQGGLAVVAGTLVQMALQRSPEAVGRLQRARRDLKAQSGRQAEKIALVVTGAWLLDRLLDDLADDEVGPHEARILKWATTADAVNHSAGEWDNRLTLDILPWALSQEMSTSPIGKPVVWVEGDSATLGGPIIWVNCLGLADLWADHQRGRTIERTDTKHAIEDQVKRCQEVKIARRFDTGRGRNDRAQALYWGITGEAARVVLERSQG